ncbi:MAG: MarR family transcriptional regulator [Clostridia bacterium]|nr:MarR family transcriptional regulator [Clostridia bacterium]
MQKTDSKSIAAVKYLMLADRLHRNAVEAAINELGIHRSQHMILMYLSCCSTTASQTDLANALEVSPAAVAVSLKKLEKAGLITRSPRADDARANTICLTDEAKKIVERSGQIFSEVDTMMCDGISDAELDGLIACVEKMIENLKNSKKTERQ